jgi:hypothetical protein
LCLGWVHVCHGILKSHAHVTLLLGKHCLLLLAMQECLLGGPLLLHKCRIHHLVLLLLLLLLLGKHVRLLGLQV